MCVKGLHTIEGEKEQDYEMGKDEVEIAEEPLVTLSCTGNAGYTKALRYKGKIGNIPVCILVDTGATHSFINPDLVQELQLPTVSIPSKTFRSDGGKRLTTDKICPNLKFTLQGYQFEANLRVLSVSGYDIILGCDWVAEMDDVIINLKKGYMIVELEGKPVLFFL